jgi:solute carrier family 25 folate transporter 32
MLTNPIWLVKTRMQLDQSGGGGSVVQMEGARGGGGGGAMAAEMPRARLSVGEVVSTIFRTEGPLAFYKGIVPALCLVSHGAFQFMFYEELKRLAKVHSVAKGEELSSFHFLGMGALSKVFASTATYPYQTVKTRLQATEALAGQYRGTLDCFRQIINQEGALALYKGIAPNILRVAPSSAVTFLCYEKMIKWLKDRDAGKGAAQ